MKLILTFLIIISTSLTAFAQWELGFGYTGSTPVDRFCESSYKYGNGLFFNLTTSSILPKNQPFKLQFGMYFDHFNAGTKRMDILLAEPINEDGKAIFHNKSSGQHYLARFGYEASPKVTVFTDFIIGRRKFYSQLVTGVKGFSSEYEDNYLDTFKSPTFRYGIGMGVRYSIGKSFGIEFRADYTRGNKAEYYKLDDITKTDDVIEWENEKWAYTDLFIASVSLNWKLFASHSSGSRTTNRVRPSPGPPVYRPTPTRTTTQTTDTRTKTRTRTKTTPPPAKKKVVPATKIKQKEEKKDDKINW